MKSLLFSQIQSAYFLFSPRAKVPPYFYSSSKSGYVLLSPRAEVAPYYFHLEPRWLRTDVTKFIATYQFHDIDLQ